MGSVGKGVGRKASAYRCDTHEPAPDCPASIAERRDCRAGREMAMSDRRGAVYRDESPSRFT